MVNGMTKRDIEKQLNKTIMNKLPEGFAAKGQLLFHTPIEWFIRGYGFHWSEYDKDKFRVIAFISPLYVPETGYYYSLHQSIGFLCYKQETWWSKFDDPQIIDCILAKGERWVGEITTPYEFAVKAKQIALKQEIVPDDMTLSRDIAYSYLLAGRQREAIAVLKDMKFELKSRIDKGTLSCWYGDLYEEVTSMEKVAEDESMACELLQNYRDKRLNMLKMKSFAVHFQQS